MDDVRKNDVPSEHQTEKNVVCDARNEGNVKILFVGNSMTYHGKNVSIGWNNEWGMAASAKEKDYVHRLCDMLSESGINTDKLL